MFADASLFMATTQQPSGAVGSPATGGQPSSTRLSGAVLFIAALFFAASAPLAAEMTGEAIYSYCKSCHGKRGAGGENGKYPRLAGLPRAYVDRQLRAFKTQKRVNKPMIPIFKHHRFDDAVIATVSAYIAGMRPPGLSLWPYQPEPDALTVFETRAAFDAAGEDQYTSGCASCHGAAGEGVEDAGAPPLTDQYPAYLRKQIADFVNGRRSHADSARCADLTPAEADAVIGYLVELGK